MPTHDHDDVARRARAQQVALFRYQLICPALDPGLSTKARGRVVRAIAAGTHAGPFGGTHRYSRDTLDRWIRRYRVGGFDALAPSTRQPGARIDTNMLELAVALKRENPDRTAAQVTRILKASGGWSPSESTLLRLFHRRGLIRPAAEGATAVFGRFEAAACNERWVGDALHGPKIGGRKTYLFAFLDDRSRLAVGYRFGFAEDTVRLAAALRPALAARGVPGSVYVDNGSAFVDAWLLRACGKLGIRLVHSTPHRPQGRGKIERWFRGARDQFLVEVTDSTAAQIAERGLTPAAALLELNALFTAWVESQYHHRVHSETGQTPLARWDDGWSAAGHSPVMPSPQALTEAFQWSRSPRPRRCRCTETSTKSRRYWSAARSSWCSPRSTWKQLRCTTAAAVTAAPCRSASPATHTRKRARKPRRQSRSPTPGSPTCNWSRTPTSSNYKTRNASDSTPSTPTNPHHRLITLNYPGS